MMTSFITDIEINHVRHLRGFEIVLDAEKPRHLIITGPNGSGKTSLLMAIKDHLNNVVVNNRQWLTLQTQRDSFANQVKSIETRSANGPLTDNDQISVDQLNKQIAAIDTQIASSLHGVAISFNEFPSLIKNYADGQFIFGWFEARRRAEVKTPAGPTPINAAPKYNLRDKPGRDFAQLLVNLKADISFSRDEGDESAASEIENWFTLLENRLKGIFNDQGLQLEFDRSVYNIYLKLSNGNRVTLNQLSDGYSAIMGIMSELIMRMGQNRNIYDMPGIVLIDEIETHLHLEMQKNAMPFLTDLFPNIQFIVSTHSPFVISSDPNSVVFDLENHIRVEDATGYSFDTIIESYYGSDKYSQYVKQRLQEYEQLSQKNDLSDQEQSRLTTLNNYFTNAPLGNAPELEVKLQQIRLAKLTGK